MAVKGRVGWEYERIRKTGREKEQDAGGKGNPWRAEE